VPKAHSVPLGLFVVFANDSTLALYSTSRTPRVREIFPGRITSTGVAADLVQVIFGPVQRVVAWLEGVVSARNAKRDTPRHGRTHRKMLCIILIRGWKGGLVPDILFFLKKNVHLEFQEQNLLPLPLTRCE
jgi:hypothetical protein